LLAIEKGYFQEEIHRSAYEYQKSVENGDIGVVGVNRFAAGKARKTFTAVKVSPMAVKNQVQRTRRIKAKRNNINVRSLLKNLEQAAVTGKNLVEPILSCVKAYATIGEISDILRDVYSEYKEKNIF
jgi:methylmalonyl-CoA mutase N-terminal domain/subunit